MPWLKVNEQRMIHSDNFHIADFLADLAPITLRNTLYDTGISLPVGSEAHTYFLRRWQGEQAQEKGKKR